MKPISHIQANSQTIKSPDKYQGWLKKLGGKLKIWKERYYVLTDTHLYYYTGTDRKKLLGEFCLDFAQIESDTGDLEYNGDKSCLLLLKINGSSSLQNNSHHNDHSQQQHQNQCQQIILCAPNPRERKLWLRAIRKVLYLHYGGVNIKAIRTGYAYADERLMNCSSKHQGEDSNKQYKMSLGIIILSISSIDNMHPNDEIVHNVFFKNFERKEKRMATLFGTHLDEVFPYTTSDNQFLPRIVYETVQFIRENGLDAEGIFRKCGKQNSIQSLADLYDLACPGPILIPNEHDVHLVSGLLKYYLRELPEPVIPYKYYDKLKAAGYRIADGKELSDFINLFDNLPSPNYNLLKYLCEFLYEVSEHEKQNRMSVASLASMFAPNFLRQQDEDPYIEMSASQLINHTVTEFIKAYQVLFPHELKSPNWDKLNINNHNIHVLHNHKDLNTLPVDFKRIQTQMNSSVSRCKTTNDRDTLMGRSQDSFTESVIYESPKNSPYHSSVNSSNNNNNINHYHHHENGRNHRATTTTTVTTTIFNNNNNKQHNNVITNPIDHIHQYNYNSILLNNAKSSHDYHTNNIYMRSPIRDHMDNNHHPATSDKNNDINNSNNNEQKESRLYLRKLHTESGEYELGSLADVVSEENLHSISYKTDSTEHTTIDVYEKEEEQRLNNVGQINSNKNTMKSIRKCFNSLPEHRHGLDLTKKSVKTRPEIPLQWSSFHNDKKLSLEKSVTPTNTTTAIHQNEPNEARISFNLDDLSKIYLNSQKLANIQTPLSNTTVTNTTSTTITDNNDNNGITKATNGKMSKDSFLNGHNKTDMNNYDTLKKRVSLKEFIDRKSSSKITQSESFNSHSPMEQIRYWRSIAAVAQANAAGQLAKTEKLTQELARLRWDLSISHMENNLLRQNLASVQAELNHVRQIPKDITNYEQHNESIHPALFP
ncbi:unnamed protein product [Schistosoma curassoni]|nr:unnamed protein product [Schistosoma curassoni]